MRVSKPSPAMVVALISLFVALSGVGYAVVKPGKNTVGPKQVKNESLTGTEVADDSLTGSDVNESSLNLPASPSSLPPSGPAGGGLAGTYPNPTIGNNAVNTPQIADNAINNAKIADNAVNSAEVGADSLTGADVDEATLALAAEPFHEVGAAGEPGFNNSSFCVWTNHSTEHQSAAFARDSAGFVHLKGLVDADDVGAFPNDCAFGSGSGDEVIFLLPAGYRPEKRSIYTTIAGGNTLARINIDGPAEFGFLAGSVSVDTAVDENAAEDFLSLDGITFRCAPSGADGCP